jgi:hypothetical protein
MAAIAASCFCEVIPTYTCSMDIDGWMGVIIADRDISTEPARPGRTAIYVAPLDDH